MQIFLRHVDGSLETLNGVQSAEDVINKHQEFRFYTAGRPLTPEDDLFNGSTVEVVVGLRGGKQHGSLAKVGKVRGQTPNVEAAEKKKKKTGRAKKRGQYNKRFVNVIPSRGPGGRVRGPNANY